MGTRILEQHLPEDSFLRRHNDASRLVAVFPATTPAALTTLATATWPGQHGQPGWDLRDQKGCEFPGKPTSGPVQITCLHPFVVDSRTKRPAQDFGFGPSEVFVQPPWTASGASSRRMRYINAYNGTGFTDWYQGAHSAHSMKIPETAMETLGTPEGSAAAVEYFRRGVDEVLKGVAEAEKEGFSSYHYLYTAHPDKHMHRLGVEHPEVRSVVLGLDSELQRLAEGLKNIDAAVVATADHGHVTVTPSDMVTLPEELLECLEYANVGVHGKGRHAYLHCRSGRSREFEEKWATNPRLRESFLLLTIEDAAAEGLFGPDPPVPSVRPRLGDFVVMSLGADTLVSPEEAKTYRDGPQARCQGAHGSVTPAELRIPFVLVKPSARA